jgi:hypothetical protein
MIGKHFFSQQVLPLLKTRTEKLGARVVTSLYVAAAGGEKGGESEMWWKGMKLSRFRCWEAFTISRRPTDSVLAEMH